jgi:predicted RNA-binding protein with PIN domain
MDILVDGYNVIKNSGLFHAAGGNLMMAREALLAQLTQRYRHTPHHVIVVFDGKGVHQEETHERRIRVIYSRYGETADSEIARLAAEARRAGREFTLYTNDREVQHAVASHGGSIHSVAHLAEQFNAPSRDVARKARHRIVVRRIYGLDPNYDPDDEPDERHRKKQKKKRK